jgi:hypothetical protein
LSVAAAGAAERIEFRQQGKQQAVVGDILVEAQDGGVLLQGRDQVIWAIQPDEIVAREEFSGEAKPLSKSELTEAVLDSLPRGFKVHDTAHYIICYNTSTAYAEWCGALYERLFRAFTNYWTRRRLDLVDPPPLIAVVFRNRQMYASYGKDELGDAINSILGYYSYHSNRIVMYDILEGRYQATGRQAASRLNQLLRKERTVATIIHEATHQLAFNCGLHQRYADIPLWLSEGLAIFFETPDLKSSKGWTTIGSVNRVRWNQFREYHPRRPSDSLLTLVAADDRFRDTQLATAAYAESWAFCYYLLRQHPDEFAAYLKIMQEKTPLNNADTQQRIDEFRTAFGSSPAAMDQDFLRAMSRVK